MTNGIYKHIRQPMYLGFLSLFFGYSISFGSVIMTILIVSALFLIFYNRMNIEENLLKSKFGNEYILYMNRTKRILFFDY
ncbi:MAG: methyltransferase family protein [Candidatus Hodarchaeales archaeon]